MSQRGTITENLEADLVVIGGGGAGMPAALTALDEGVKKVIVLEKRFATGGDALRANWIFAVESRLQKEAGVTVTADDIYERALEFHRYDRVKPRILRALINKTSDMIRWLEEKGVEFELRSMSPDPKIATSHWTKGAGTPDTLCSFGHVFRLLTRKCQEGGVQFLVHTSGKKIQRGPDGKVTGVVAQTRDGQEFEIKTRSVILCPGSFIGNKELLKKYFPFYYDDVYWTDALLSNVGEGLTMAEDAGAAMEDFCTLIRHGGKSRATVVNNRREMLEPTLIRVNKKGQRFLSESAHEVSGNVQLQQPGKTVYAIYDDKIVQSVVDKGPRLQVARIAPPLDSVPTFREYLQGEDKKGVWVKISDSWDDIAEWIGCDAKVLKATIDEYNSFCDKGYDEDFAKDKRYLVPLRTPPYYAHKNIPLMIETIGPVRVNERMEVLDKQDNPIPGFFAAGVVTSGWESYDYGGTPAGTALGFSMCSGRIAAESASRFLLGK